MNIIVNSIPLLSKLTGVGRYTYEVITNLRSMDYKNRYFYYYGVGLSEKILQSKTDLFELLPWYNLRHFRQFIKVGNLIINKNFSSSFLYYFNRSIRFIIKSVLRSILYVSTSKYDIYFEPNFIPLPEISAEKVVATVHDFTFHLYPQWHPKDRVEFFKRNFWKNIYRAEVIITGSDFIKEQAKELIKGYKGQIICIHYGYDSDVFKIIDRKIAENYQKIKKLPKQYFLFVGSIEPRKNLLSLLKAYASLPKNIREEFKLLLAGFTGWKNREIIAMLNALSEDVYYLGYISDQELVLLYNLATASVYPSFYEGFGLPNIEAMACGCPVITSDIPPIKEACGDAAFYVNPYDIESIRHGMITLVENEQIRNNLIQKGLQQVKNFSWEESARKHLEVFLSL